MKVVLLQNVSGVGIKGDLQEVADGYALNYLIPQKLAKFATPQMVAEAHSFKRRKATQQAKKIEKSHRTIKSLEGKDVTITGKVNEKGHLFAQIHENDIAVAISEQHSVDSTSLKIELAQPIKEVGTYKTAVSITGKDTAVLNVVVEAEEE